jgi:hypothetical protein
VCVGPFRLIDQVRGEGRGLEETLWLVREGVVALHLIQGKVVSHNGEDCRS